MNQSRVMAQLANIRAAPPLWRKDEGGQCLPMPRHSRS
jgi:hypothetical protein